jgi:hypothetical protein
MGRSLISFLYLSLYWLWHPRHDALTPSRLWARAALAPSRAMEAQFVYPEGAKPATLPSAAASASKSWALIAADVLAFIHAYSGHGGSGLSPQIVPPSPALVVVVVVVVVVVADADADAPTPTPAPASAPAPDPTAIPAPTAVPTAVPAPGSPATPTPPSSFEQAAPIATPPSAATIAITRTIPAIRSNLAIRVRRASRVTRITFATIAPR